MNLPNKQLRQLIKEELEAVLDEGENSFDYTVILEPTGPGASGGDARKFKAEFKDKLDPGGSLRIQTQKSYSDQSIRIGKQGGMLHLAAIIFNEEGHPEIAEKIKSGRTQVIR